MAALGPIAYQVARGGALCRALSTQPSQSHYAQPQRIREKCKIARIRARRTLFKPVGSISFPSSGVDLWMLAQQLPATFVVDLADAADVRVAVVDQDAVVQDGARLGEAAVRTF